MRVVSAVRLYRRTDALTTSALTHWQRAQRTDALRVDRVESGPPRTILRKHLTTARELLEGVTDGLLRMLFDERVLDLTAGGARRPGEVVEDGGCRGVRLGVLSRSSRYFQTARRGVEGKQGFGEVDVSPV